MTIAWEHESKPATEIVATLDANGAAAPWPDVKKYLANTSASGTSGPLVQWDTPIPPPEAYGILAKMSSFKEATVYKVGQSLSRQGRLGDGPDAARSRRRTGRRPSRRR